LLNGRPVLPFFFLSVPPLFLVAVPFRIVCSAAPWPARWGHAVVSSGSTVLLLGGIGWWDATNRSTALTDLWRSRDLGASWELVTSEVPFGVRQGAAAVLEDGGAMILVGGETLNEDTYTDGQLYGFDHSHCFSSGWHTAFVSLFAAHVYIIVLLSSVAY
jgi:hypothetical protein